MSVYSLSQFCAQEINRLMEFHKSGSYKIFVCGDSSSISECLQIFESFLNEDGLSHIVVATDEVRPIQMQYGHVRGLKTIYWNGVDSLKEYLLTEFVPIRMVIDLKPSLRRLHKISEIVHAGSLIIINEEGNCWRSIFPALFASFEEKNTTLINFDEYWAEQTNLNIHEDFYFDHRLRI